jgi:hypothetical protein
MLTPGYRLRLTVESSKRAVKDTNILGMSGLRADYWRLAAVPAGRS